MLANIFHLKCHSRYLQCPSVACFIIINFWERREKFFTSLGRKVGRFEKVFASLLIIFKMFGRIFWHSRVEKIEIEDLKDLPGTFDLHLTEIILEGRLNDSQIGFNLFISNDSRRLKRLQKILNIDY